MILEGVRFFRVLSDVNFIQHCWRHQTKTRAKSLGNITQLLVTLYIYSQCAISVKYSEADRMILKIAAALYIILLLCLQTELIFKQIYS